MKHITLAAALLAATLVSAHGQTSQSPPPASPGPGNKAINERGENNPGAPVAGANSFTEGQARSRIESNGFTNVSDLRKDAEGVWRGTATKDGRQQSVAVDFQGNVVAK
jgi:hypothetical protein